MNATASTSNSQTWELKTLQEIAQKLADSDKKAQLIYAFNGTGKTRLSREFKELISRKSILQEEIYKEYEKLDECNERLKEAQTEEDKNRLEEEKNRINQAIEDVEKEMKKIKVIYYNAFTEDLFHWDNDLDEDRDRKLIITQNTFTAWILMEEWQENKIIKNFQNYTSNKLLPRFNEQYVKKDGKDKNENIIVPAFSEVNFSYFWGDDFVQENIKISRGEESCFIWCIFYTLFQQVVEILNIAELDNRSTDKFNDLKYIFIDDPVSSLDENHLIELAVDIAELIKTSKSNLKFIITTHNPVFYNVLYNEFNKENFQPYKLEKIDNQLYILNKSNDSPFAYQIHLKHKLEDLFKEEMSRDDLKNLLTNEDKKDILDDLLNGMKEDDLKNASKQFEEFNDLYIKKIFVRKQYYRLEFFRDKKIEECNVEKYHFNFMRNILEKMSTFLGYYEFTKFLPKDREGSSDLYVKRIDGYVNRMVNFWSHSKHSGDEGSFVVHSDKRVLKYILNHLNEKYFNAKYINFLTLNKKFLW